MSNTKPRPSGASVLIPQGEFEEGPKAAKSFLDAMKAMLKSPKKEADRASKAKRN